MPWRRRCRPGHALGLTPQGLQNQLRRWGLVAGKRLAEGRWRLLLSLLTPMLRPPAYVQHPLKSLSSPRNHMCATTAACTTARAALLSLKIRRSYLCISIAETPASTKLWHGRAPLWRCRTLGGICRVRCGRQQLLQAPLAQPGRGCRQQAAHCVNLLVKRCVSRCNQPAHWVMERCLLMHVSATQARQVENATCTTSGTCSSCRVICRCARCDNAGLRRSATVAS
jgi:hypothetical protein